MTLLPVRQGSFLVLLALTSVLGGCAGFEPMPLEQVPFRAQQETQSIGGIDLSVAVPTTGQAEQIYGVPLASVRVQPIWLEVTNHRSHAFWFLPAGLDAHHFTPSEASFAFHRGSRNAEVMDSHFESLAFKNPILPGQTVSGFVLVNLDEGYKAVDIDLISRSDSRSFTFAFADPDFPADASRVNVDTLWSEDELREIEDEAELRAALEALPTCTTNESGDEDGDPLNLVLIGARHEIFAAIVRRGWHATEVISAASVWRTIKAFFSGDRYHHSPISALYVYDRVQDFSAQKVRESISERNHMRVWRTPILFRGRDVWVGQISRDIGIKLTNTSLRMVTHKIDPDVDEVRRYLLEDLAYSQAVQRIAFCEGVGRVPPEEPRHNLAGDPYYTDGYRAVMFFEPRPTSLGDIEFLDWEIPARRQKKRE